MLTKQRAFPHRKTRDETPISEDVKKYRKKSASATSIFGRNIVIRYTHHRKRGWTHSSNNILTGRKGYWKCSEFSDTVNLPELVNFYVWFAGNWTHGSKKWWFAWGVSLSIGTGIYPVFGVHLFCSNQPSLYYLRQRDRPKHLGVGCQGSLLNIVWWYDWSEHLVVPKK